MNIGYFVMNRGHNYVQFPWQNNIPKIVHGGKHAKCDKQTQTVCANNSPNLLMINEEN